MSSDASNPTSTVHGPLALLRRADWIHLILLSLVVGMLFVLFHLQGNTTHVSVFGASALVWMVDRWGDAYGSTADYSHGWLIPIVSLAALWSRRRAIAAAPRSVSAAGLAVVVLALLIHWLGAKTQQTRLSLFGLVLLTWGIPFYLSGWRVAKELIFPCSYLIFCIPLNFFDSLTFPLRLFSTAAATGMLNGLGIAAERSGSAIRSLAAGGFTFDVADPCSGIHSLLAMTALTAGYAWWTQSTLLRKWALFLSSIPLAIIGNIGRIVTIAIVAEAFGQEAAIKLYHDYSGYITFTFGIVCMVAIGQLLQLEPNKLRETWKRAKSAPT